MDEPKKVTYSLTTGDMVNIVIAAATVTALTLSTCQYNKNIERENYQLRPIITAKTTRFNYDTTQNPMRVMPIFNIQNFGARPASDFSYTF